MEEQSRGHVIHTEGWGWGARGTQGRLPSGGGISIFLKLIIFWLCLDFVAVHGLSLVAASGGYSPVVV